MMKRIFCWLALAALGTDPVAAQVFTPTFQGPRTGNDIGVYVLDFGDPGVEAVFRRPMARVSDLGLRIGAADLESATALFLGADFRSPLQLQGASPVALAVTLGAQAILLEAEAWGIQGGVSAGYTFQSPGLSLTPYLHPRLALRDVADEQELELLADFGVDVGLTPDLDLRLGVNLGADWGLGLAFRR